MSRLSRLLAVVWCLVATPIAAQDGFGALARVDPDESAIQTDGRNGVTMSLGLSQGVPFRLFTLDDPRRLVIDFREVDWTGLDADHLNAAEAVTAVRFGTFRPGWSRLVADLDRPLAVDTAALSVAPETSKALLTVVLSPTSDAAFRAAAGAPRDPRWDLPEPALGLSRSETSEADVLHVVLDPGHGGIDPGAERGGVDEKTLMLTFARELQDLLTRAGGYEVTLTRDGDYFVSLERRVAIAHEVDADVFISLHADSLAEGQAHGATVHVLARDASDVASAKLAERHDRDDLLSGVDLSETDDEVTRILLDLARRETQPRTEALADAIVSGMAQTGGPMNRRPMRMAAFSVLKAADIPSVLIEIGFLSSPRDFKNLTTPDWRAGMAEGIVDGLNVWRQEDVARRALVRQ